jgi:hypothetical protein
MPVPAVQVFNPADPIIVVSLRREVGKDMIHIKFKMGGHNPW